MAAAPHAPLEARIQSPSTDRITEQLAAQTDRIVLQLAAFRLTNSRSYDTTRDTR